MMAQKCRIETISDVRYDLGEAPHWNSKTGDFCFLDAFVGNFHRLNSAGDFSTVHFDDTVTYILPYEEDADQFVVSKSKEICKLDWKKGTLTTLSTVEKDVVGTRFNDGKCDSSGRLWAGTMALESSPGVLPPEKGSLYSFDGSAPVHHVDKVSLSNGLTWSNDDKFFFFIDSVKRHIYVFDYEKSTGAISNQRVLFDFANQESNGAKGLPDGMTIDTNGNLWVACYDGGRILRIDPNIGKLLDYIEMPATKVTSLCFAGKNLDTLYVTSASQGLKQQEAIQQPLAGSLFKITLESQNAKGNASHSFRG